jgi:hypothetical protein
LPFLDLRQRLARKECRVSPRVSRCAAAGETELH